MDFFYVGPFSILERSQTDLLRFMQNQDVLVRRVKNKYIHINAMRVIRWPDLMHSNLLFAIKVDESFGKEI